MLSSQLFPKIYVEFGKFLFGGFDELLIVLCELVVFSEEVRLSEDLVDLGAFGALDLFEGGLVLVLSDKVVHLSLGEAPY